MQRAELETRRNTRAREIAKHLVDSVDLDHGRARWKPMGTIDTDERHAIDLAVRILEVSGWHVQQPDGISIEITPLKAWGEVER
jgi:hypothetical protein